MIGLPCLIFYYKVNLVPKGVSGSNNWNFASSVNHYGASQHEISRKKENCMMKKSRSLTMSICLLCILGLAIIPASAGLKDTLQSDEFDGSKLSEIWSIDNPDIGSFKVGGGKLTVTGGFNGNVWGNSDALFFYQEVSQQNFDITTDFIHDYQGGSTVAGLLVESETTKDTKARDGQWVTLKLWGRGGDDNNAVLQYQRRENDSEADGYVGIWGENDADKTYQPDAGQISISLRLKRDGDIYESWFKPEGKGDWVWVGKVTSALKDPVKVGIYAGIAESGGDATLTNTFHNFIEASSAVTAVDPKNRLTTTWGHLKEQ